jgi:hypothetical protein
MPALGRPLLSTKAAKPLQNAICVQIWLNPDALPIALPEPWQPFHRRMGRAIFQQVQGTIGRSLNDVYFN